MGFTHPTRDVFQQRYFDRPARQAVYGFHEINLQELLVIWSLQSIPAAIGTLINGYIIWLILSKKGRLILSPEYAAIVEATSHIKYRTSIVVWILLGLIVLLVVVITGVK